MRTRRYRDTPPICKSCWTTSRSNTSRTKREPAICIASIFITFFICIFIHTLEIPWPRSWSSMPPRVHGRSWETWHRRIMNHGWSEFRRLENSVWRIGSLKQDHRMMMMMMSNRVILVIPVILHIENIWGLAEAQTGVTSTVCVSDLFNTH